MTAWANVELVVEGLQSGAVDFIEKPWNKTALLNKINRQFDSVFKPNQQQNEWIARSPAMQKIEAVIKQLAPTEANILITGENGTGKSLLAQQIHQMSLRAENQFESLNMAAIPETLFESELFGHEKGAFTDAKKDRKGAFQRAENGTLFLDEIGTLPNHLQPKLLQVLESGCFTPLGANQTFKANVRIIAATNIELNSAVEQGQFRQDLLYRLNTFTIEIPTLKSRAEDIVPLAELMLSRLASKYQKPKPELSQQAIDKLLAYRWPGNVRELNHVMERAMLFCEGSEILIDDLQLQALKTSPSAANLIPELTLVDLEIRRITDVMQQSNGQIALAAKTLGISRNALYRRLEKYQLAEQYE